MGPSVTTAVGSPSRGTKWSARRAPASEQQPSGHPCRWSVEKGPGSGRGGLYGDASDGYTRPPARRLGYPPVARLASHIHVSSGCRRAGAAAVARAARRADDGEGRRGRPVRAQPAARRAGAHSPPPRPSKRPRRSCGSRRGGAAPRTKPTLEAHSLTRSRVATRLVRAPRVARQGARSVLQRVGVAMLLASRCAHAMRCVGARAARPSASPTCRLRALPVTTWRL